MDIIPVKEISDSLGGINASIDEITMVLGKLVAACTGLWMALAPLVKMASHGKLPGWFAAVVKGLQKAAGPFAVNGKPVGKDSK